jgi:hypothetical protein
MVHGQRRVGRQRHRDRSRQGRAPPRRLRELIGATVEQVKIVPGLADLALEHEPTQIELDLDVAEDFLDIAPVELQRMGIELIGPNA